MNKLTIVLSGRKQAGKTSTCNYIRAKYLNRCVNGVPGVGTKLEFGIDHAGELICKEYGPDFYTYLSETDIRKGYRTLGYRELATQVVANDVKVYSFADPLKDFCINVLGVPFECCWGTDAQKNSLQEHLLWENVPEQFRPKVDANNYESGSGEDKVNAPKLKTGPMTAREVMQIFGTDICRRLYGDCWARGTYSKIKTEGHELALVADGRFPNEISMGNSVNAKTIRLTRKVTEDGHASETALDAFTDYTLVLDNTGMTLDEQCRNLDPILDEWFEEAGYNERYHHRSIGTETSSS